MNYKPRPKEKDTPSRKTRKNSRTSVFVYNSRLAPIQRRERRLARKAAREAAEAAEYEEYTEE